MCIETSVGINRLMHERPDNALMCPTLTETSVKWTGLNQVTTVRIMRPAECKPDYRSTGLLPVPQVKHKQPLILFSGKVLEKTINHPSSHYVRICFIYLLTRCFMSFWRPGKTRISDSTPWTRKLLFNDIAGNKLSQNTSIRSIDTESNCFLC